MSERERLVELLKQNCHCKDEDYSNCSSNGICFTHREADYLLENGVIVPPVKIGQTVYKINGVSLREYEVDYFDIFKDSSNFTFKIHLDSKNWTDYVFIEDFGKTAFLTKEKAEKALKGGAE